jgi:hypothetical protein
MGLYAASMTVWSGRYEFGRDPKFLRSVAVLARAERTRDRVEPNLRPAEFFRARFEELRRAAPKQGVVLFDHMVHRCSHPNCPPCLYALTCTLRASRTEVLLNERGRRVTEVTGTKVGQTERCLAERLPAYTTDVLNSLPTVRESLTLRLVIYGEAPSMLAEREFRDVAGKHACRVTVVHRVSGRERRLRETYLGDGVVEALTKYARKRARGTRG